MMTTMMMITTTMMTATVVMATVVYGDGDVDYKFIMMNLMKFGAEYWM